MTANDGASQIGPRAIYEGAKTQADRALRESVRTDDLKEASALADVAWKAEDRMVPDRPRKGWMGLMCRGLGGLPDVEKPHATYTAGALALVLVVGAIILVPMLLA